MGANEIAQTSALFRKNLVIQDVPARRTAASSASRCSSARCWEVRRCSSTGSTTAQRQACPRSTAATAPPRPSASPWTTTWSEGLFAQSNARCLSPPNGPLWCSCPDLEMPSTDPADAFRRSAKSYPLTTFFFTGSNKSLAESVISNVFPAPSNSSGDNSSLADFALGTHEMPVSSASVSDELGTAVLQSPLYFLQSKCTPDTVLPFPVQVVTENATNGETLT
ncbi:hypothetical protein ACP70R_042992 [Stipagrostis hirtigluma subsp. patula]